MRTCYIAAPVGTQLVTLRSVLGEKGFHVIAPDDLPIGSNRLTEISSVLPQVDLVIGVLTKERRSEWVLFELGQAWAAKRQILLFAPPSSSVPSNLRHVLVVRTSLGNREAIRFVLDQFLASPRDGTSTQAIVPPPHHPKVVKVGKVLGSDASAYIARCHDALDRRDWLAFEEIVSEALRKSGVDVIAGHPNDDRADLAIWSDALQPFVGNPLLIEVRGRIENAGSARTALKRLSESIASSGAIWGLLIYGSGPAGDAKPWTDTPPNILTISIFELLERMRGDPFEEVVKTLRNQRVHRREH